MAATTEKKENKKSKESTILIFAIVVPIAVALLILAGSVIWDGIVVILKAVVPSGWVIIAYLYVALIAFLAGRISKKK